MLLVDKIEGLTDYCTGKDDLYDCIKGKSIEEIVETCNAGNLFFWLGKTLSVDDKKLHLAKGYCGNLAEHLMSDIHKKVVRADLDYGSGKITKEQLESTNKEARFTYIYLEDDPAYVFSSYTYDIAAYVAQPFSTFFGDDDMTEWRKARRQCQKQMADICREYLGRDIIEKVKQLYSPKPVN